VRVYWALFRTVFQQHLQYRVSAAAGAVTNIAYGFFRIFLLTAFYGASRAVEPMELGDLYSYIWFGQVLFGVLPVAGTTIGSDSEEIRSGDVAYRLTRPVSLYGYTFARIMGEKITALCSRSLIQVVIIFGLFPLFGLSRYGMRLPDGRLLPFLLVSLVLTILLSAAIQASIVLSAFWTVSMRGTATLAYAVISLFSGLLVPLAFFPPVLRAVADVLPFRGVYDTSAMLYAGSFTLQQALLGLGHQAGWLAAIVVTGALMARRGTARLEVAGG